MSMELRHSKRYQGKRLLLHLLFPARLVACIALAVLSYQHWYGVSGRLLCTVLFALVIFLCNGCGWLGVTLANWSLAVAFNAVSVMLLLIDIHQSVFDLPYHLIALVLTVLILIVNLMLAADLDNIRRQDDRIKRARLDAEEARRKQLERAKQLADAAAVAERQTAADH